VARKYNRFVVSNKSSNSSSKSLLYSTGKDNLLTELKKKKKKKKKSKPSPDEIEEEFKKKFSGRRA
jgi:hypothetical protein